MSDILTSLKFCAGSVAKKNIVPELTHFCIEDGRVKGFNGTLALSAPIAVDINCKPEATKLIDVIANCEDSIHMTLTPTGKLSIRSGAFKALVNCIQGETPHEDPEGERVDFDGEAFFEGIKTVAPFIGEDASRRWSHGILFRDKSLYCTNNVILVQYWIGVDFPRVVNLPRAAVKEMLRIGEAPIYAQVAENSVSFHYSDDRWLRTQLYSTQDWPDIGKALNAPSNQRPLDARLFDALEVLKKMVGADGSIYFKGGIVTTHMDDNEGASYLVPDLLDEGKYHIEMLAKLKGNVDTIDFSTYPRPCAFTKGMLRGIIIGKRPDSSQL
jgi:hypothetical protein